MLLRLLVVTVLLLSSACAEFSPFAQHYYLDKESISAEVIGKPVHPKTAAWKKQIQSVMTAQKAATAAQLDQARYEHTQLTSDIFVAVANPALTRQNAPHIFQLLDRAKEDCMNLSAALKGHWNIPRPYLTDARVKPLLPNPSTSSSFPSSHATCSKVVADILSDLYPAKKQSLTKRAEVSAHYRMILGLHYPHDLAAGRKLAAAFYQKLKQSKAFTDDFASAKSEMHFSK